MASHDTIRKVRFKCMDLNVVVKGTNRLYTRALGESIIERFKSDSYFREHLFCVLGFNSNGDINYPDVVGIITDITLDDETIGSESLIAELTILNTPAGRIVDETLDSLSLRLYPSGYADETNIDGIEIMTSDSYDLIGFTIGPTIKR